MELRLMAGKEGEYTFKVGPRRVEDGGIALVWALNKRGALKAAKTLADGRRTAIVKIEVGDTIFMIRTGLLSVKTASSYYVEGRNVRSVRKDLVVGPVVGEWVPAEFIPVGVRAAADLWLEKKDIPGKYFVKFDPTHPTGVEPNSVLVYSTEDPEPEKEVHSDTRVAIFGKKKRSV